MTREQQEMVGCMVLIGLLLIAVSLIGFWGWPSFFLFLGLLVFITAVRTIMASK
jgi:hypothetical protein